MYFSKEYKNCPLDESDGRLMLTYVEAQGEDLEDMLSNALISLEDWHGNEGPDWDLDSLPHAIYEMVMQDIASHIQDCIEHNAERLREQRLEIAAINNDPSRLKWGADGKLTPWWRG